MLDRIFTCAALAITTVADTYGEATRNGAPDEDAARARSFGRVHEEELEAAVDAAYRRPGGRALRHDTVLGTVDRTYESARHEEKSSRHAFQMNVARIADGEVDGRRSDTWRSDESARRRGDDGLIDPVQRADQSDLADVAVRRGGKTQRRTRWRFPAPKNGTSANTGEDQFHTTARVLKGRSLVSAVPFPMGRYPSPGREATSPWRGSATPATQGDPALLAEI
jgi:hypothetical protein